LKASIPAMTEKFFNELLHYCGKEASWHLTSHMEFLNLDLCNYRCFCVVVFDVENAGELKDGLGVSQYEMLLFRLCDTIRNYCRVFDYSYLLKGFDGLNLILFQNSSSNSHVLQSVHKIISSVVEEFLGSEISLNVGIGNIVTDLWNVKLSYESALRALEYRFFFPQKNVFDAREAFGRNVSLEPFSEASEDELIRLICQKDYSALERWIRNFSTTLITKYQDKSFIFVRVYTLLGQILKFLCELNIEISDLEEKIAKTYSRLNTFNTSEKFFSWLYEICMLSCQKLDASLKTYHSQLCESVVGYIRDNYESSDLCLHDIAKFANVSPAYLSALFKKNTGASISDTITATRIETARHYLEHSSLSLKEISEKCGYANQYYFSTSFKKNMGMSPSAYRSTHTDSIV
ncbi:MAG: helix-turn-helix domain-containing protein, partial [Clostridiales bacterium]|nr:helix-turn-helix domain-containing protein [Clostridiales bacterium]